MTDCNIV